MQICCVCVYHFRCSLFINFDRMRSILLGLIVQGKYSERIYKAAHPIGPSPLARVVCSWNCPSTLLRAFSMPRARCRRSLSFALHPCLFLGVFVGVLPCSTSLAFLAWRCSFLRLFRFHFPFRRAFHCSRSVKGASCAIVFLGFRRARKSASAASAYFSVLVFLVFIVLVFLVFFCVGFFVF